MHAMKSTSEAGRDTPQFKNQFETKPLSVRLRRQSQNAKYSGTPGSHEIPSVAFLRSGWLLLSGLGLVSLFYAAILIYHVSVPPSDSHAHSFMERTRRLCIRYGLVSSLNPEPAVPKEAEAAAQSNVASTGVSEVQIPEDLQNGR